MYGEYICKHDFTKRNRSFVVCLFLCIIRFLLRWRRPSCFFLLFKVEQEHNHNKETTPETPPSVEKIFKDDELINLIDPILNMDDYNKDGYIDYPEFVRAQSKNPPSKPQQ